MIIVAGHLRVRSCDRDLFLSMSRSAVSAARTTVGCLDFAVSPDPVDDDRVNIFERWLDRDALLAFRGDGPSDDMVELITSADIREFMAEPAGTQG